MRVSLEIMLMEKKKKKKVRVESEKKYSINRMVKEKKIKRFA